MSERIDAQARPQNLLETNPMRQLFGDLPVDSSFRPEWLSPLIGPEKTDPFEIKETIKNRYARLSEIRQKYGVEGDFAITNEIAVALLDDNLFAQILLETQLDGQTHEVARHEIGHKFVAESLGWKTSLITVVPAAGYLGLTVSNPSHELSLDDWLLESAAISFGGQLAAQMSGDHVHGAGSDMAGVYAKAQIAASFSSRFRSEEQFISEARNIARDALKGIGTTTIRKSASKLAWQKVAV